MTEHARGRTFRATRLGAGGVLGVVLVGLVTLIGVLLTSVLLSLILAPFRYFLARVRRPRQVAPSAPAEGSAEPTPWQPTAAIDAHYEEVS